MRFLQEKNVTIKTGGSMKIVNGVSVLGTGTLAGTLTLKTTPVWFN
jgi:hypothetical protein